MPAATIDCDAHDKRQQAILDAAEILRRGGLVVFPTETVYGVGASVATGRGIQRLREIKQRTDNQPFTVHIPGPDAAALYVDLESAPLLARLIRKTMPGPITIFTDVSEDVIAEKLTALDLGPEARDRIYRGHEIGLRCPDHPVARELLSAVGQPVVASSANLPGAPLPTSAEHVRPLAAEVDLILDGGPSRFSKASTIVRVAAGKLQVIREGSFDRRYLEKIMQQTIVFVCSGNTCRSPMAEAIARHELAARFNTAPGKLHEHGVTVLSAGAFAMPGAPMTPEAEEALAKIGITPERHCARPLTTTLVNEADAVFCMTDSHLQAVREIAPGVGSKAVLLDVEGGVEDPIGGGIEVYVECARKLRTLVRRRLDELGLGASSGGAPHRKSGGRRDPKR